MKGTWLLDLLDETYSSGAVFFGDPDGGKLPSGPVKPKGTFAELPPEALLKFSQKVDAYRYLGPRDLLLNEPAPAAVFLDKDYMAELQRKRFPIPACAFEYRSSICDPIIRDEWYDGAAQKGASGPRKGQKSTL